MSGHCGNKNFYFQEKTGRPVISVLKDEELHQMENMAKRLTTLAKVKRKVLLLIIMSNFPSVAL